MTITVANKRDRPSGEYVGRPSPLGNPFRIGRDKPRERVIAMYADWLSICLREPESEQAREFAYLVELARKGDLTLICHCHPLACHADIIKARIEAAIGGDR